jgi:predicted metal-binding membrane protein
MRAAPFQPRFPPFAIGLILISWAAIALWDASPYGRFLRHGDWTPIGLAARLCEALPAGDWLVPGLLYVGGWTLMTAAMMLPTVLPLLRVFDRAIARRSDRGALRGLLIAGYLGAWAAFGVIAHGLDTLLHMAATRSTWLAAHGWVPTAGVLLLAGAFQFSPLKHLCLDRCRSPMGFLIGHWRGIRPGREAFRLGVAHGVFCVGCCWALMLLMFLVGTGNIAWMLVLGLLMAVEKNHAWGRRMSAPLGALLVVLSGLVVLTHP